jgi:hypothetical protein
VTVDDVAIAERACTCLAPSGSPGQTCRCGGLIATVSEARDFWRRMIASGTAQDPDEMNRKLTALISGC